MDSTSSSDASPSSSLVSVSPESKKCQICYRTAHGYHHGAYTCRACCIFFRRSAGSENKWECRKNGKCGTDKNITLCKKCRLAKCFECGMRVENFQQNRDANRQTTRFKRISDVPMSLEKFVGRPYIVIGCDPNTPKPRRIFLDLTGLVEKGKHLLAETHWDWEKTSSIQKLAIHMRESRKVKSHGKVIYRQFGKKESLTFWQIDFCRAAEWLSHFDEFHQLSVTMKMEFLKSIWNVRSVLERVVLTAEKRAKNEISEYLIPLDEDAAVDKKNLEVDLSWCTHYEKDKIGYFLDMFRMSDHLEMAVKVLMDLKPTDVEQNFLFLQICFNYAGKLHQGKIQQISEDLLESVSNQMHDYYSNVLKMPNYSGRVARLLKCDQFIQGFITMRRQKIEIGQIFDIFHLKYSHPEMFTNFGYS